MAVTVSKAGPYFSSGEIKFSDLRKNFRSQVRKVSSGDSETFSPDPATDTAAISASELLRDIDTTEQSPIVPDCTENRESGPLSSGISASDDWKVSQFRNSIKYYYVTLPSSDDVTNFDIDAQTWNTNLDKNINKFMFIDGTCGSNSSSSPAATFNATAYNFTIDHYGSILGYGGAGGTASTISGENGGDALSIASSGGNNIVVLVRTGSRIYGGGGGGEKGKTGNRGSTGSCYNWSYYSANSGCEWCGSCGGGEQIGGCNGIQGCDCFIWCRRTLLAAAQCRRKNSSDKNGGDGGAGGNGAKGRGYDNQSSSLTGPEGSEGANGNCDGFDGTNSTPGKGNKGETGGDGGDWGSPGGNTNNSGNGGSAGNAVTGSNYSITGTLNASTIKGSYTP